MEKVVRNYYIRYDAYDDTFTKVLFTTKDKAEAKLTFQGLENGRIKAKIGNSKKGAVKLFEYYEDLTSSVIEWFTVGINQKEGRTR